MPVQKTQIVDALRELFGSDSPTVTKAIERKRAADDAERRQHGEAIQATERERDERLPALNAAQDKAFARLKDARAQLAAAERAYFDARDARHTLLHTTEYRVTKHRYALRETAPEAIGDTIAKVLDLEAALRSNGYDADHKTEYLVSGKERRVLVASNFHAVQCRLVAAFAAIQSLEALRETYVAPADLPAAIARVLETIPGGLSHETPKERVSPVETIGAAA